MGLPVCRNVRQAPRGAPPAGLILPLLCGDLPNAHHHPPAIDNAEASYSGAGRVNDDVRHLAIVCNRAHLVLSSSPVNAVAILPRYCSCIEEIVSNMLSRGGQQRRRDPNR